MTGAITCAVYLAVAVAAVTVLWRSSRQAGWTLGERALAVLYLAVAWPAYLIAGLWLLAFICLVGEREAAGMPRDTHTASGLAPSAPGDPPS